MRLRGIAAWRRTLAAPLLVALGVSAVGAQIEPYNGLEPPDLLELTGHVGKPARNETGGWDLVLGDRFKRRTWHFHLFHMRVLNSGRLPMDILSAVEPYTPNFYLFAEQPDQTKAIEAATPTDRLVITGYRRRGSRNILLTDVRLLPPPTPAATGVPP
ncbi:MAG: hypothetical protein SF182_10795 [Deltaproteobacteria bacterium]|nr:hypothetical protein [Deltaproteobacteria bacterium]